MPSGVVKKVFTVRYNDVVWYPAGRSQDFFIGPKLRVQLFTGDGGSKKWVRFIVVDTDDSSGFLNRGALVFHDDHDKGYFIGGINISLGTDVSWINFLGRDPRYVPAGISYDGVNDSRIENFIYSLHDDRSSFRSFNLSSVPIWSFATFCFNQKWL